MISLSGEEKGNLLKPLKHILRISRLLCHHRNANRVTIPVKSRFLVDSKSKQCVVLLKGHFSIVRKNDGLYLGTLKAPMIAGLLVSMPHLIISESDMDVCFLSSQDALDTIHSHGLWENFSHIMAFYIDILLVRDEMVFGYDSYKVVRNFILDISMNEELSEKINICDFITQRTNLSRSTVMNIISNLRKGGYIEIKNGRLMKLGRLPEKY